MTRQCRSFNKLSISAQKCQVSAQWLNCIQSDNMLFTDSCISVVSQTQQNHHSVIKFFT